MKQNNVCVSTCVFVISWEKLELEGLFGGIFGEIVVRFLVCVDLRRKRIYKIKAVKRGKEV